jgi:hypothetical protein
MSGTNVLVLLIKKEWTVWLGDVNQAHFRTKDQAIIFARTLAFQHDSRLWLQVGRNPPQLLWSPDEQA